MATQPKGAKQESKSVNGVQEKVIRQRSAIGELRKCDAFTAREIIQWGTRTVKDNRKKKW